MAKRRKKKRSRSAAAKPPLSDPELTRMIADGPSTLLRSPYVSEAVKGALPTRLAHDPRIKVWLHKLHLHLQEIVGRGRLTSSDVSAVVRMIDDWEKEGPNHFKSKAIAAKSVASVLERVTDLVRGRFAVSGRVFGHPEISDLGDVVECTLGCKSDAMKTGRRIAQPEGQGAVTTYLHANQSLLEATQREPESVRGDEGEGIRIARIIWAQLRNARVFEFPMSTFNALTEYVSKQMVVHFDERIVEQRQSDEPDQDLRLTILDRIRLAASNLPFPEKVPFEYTYIGIGAGVVLDQRDAKLRVHFERDDDIDDLVAVELFGYLICEPTEQVFEILHVIMVNDDYILPLAQRYDGVWGAAETFAPWVVRGLLDIISEHTTVVVNHRPTDAMGEEYRRVRKSAPMATGGFLPKPYYTLRMQDKVIDEAKTGQRGQGPGRILTRRYDREAHERCRVHRGIMPIDPKVEAKLTKLGYRFIDGRPGPEDAYRLAKRRMPPKRTDEWMAIKVSRIQQQMVGDPSLPYIPAVRVPAKRKAS